MRKGFYVKRHGCRGLSLVELLVVMAILSIVMLAVMSLYVPVHQSTVAQTQVSDVQDNLRLALKVMTQDLLTAGFLVPLNPIVFEASATPTTADNPDDDDFTIRTRAVGKGFARLASASSISGGIQLTVKDAEMVAAFPVGAKVRIFEPISAVELISDTITDDADRVYTVVAPAPSGTTINLSVPAGALGTLTSVATVAGAINEYVLLRVKDATQPPLQTIRYRLNNGALQREVNGDVQILARNMTAVNFDYNITSEGRVNRVSILLTGQTQALKNDTISGAKTRTVKTAVKLRNIY